MIGTTISHYKILEKLGEGGMGVVYKATDTQLNRTVALKFLPDRVQKDADAKARFLHEAQAAAALNHPNISTIHGVEDVDGSLFMVMEYIEGGTLKDKFPFRNVDDAITVAIQIGEALQKAHEKGIVHRDVKSDNVMLTSDGQAKVMDFGLAKLKGALKLTRTSSTVGTLGYMAPEQIQGREVDHRSDIFSFGVLLFETLTGKLPFRGEHEAAMMYSILNEEPQPLRSFRSDVPERLETIIGKALEKEAGRRYQSIQEMVADLEGVRNSSSNLQLQGRRLRSSFIPGKKKQLLAVGAFVLVAAAIVAVLMMKSGPRAIDSIAVLPFENVGGNPDVEYLSDGITENLINRLSQISSLRVIPRSTVFTFKGKAVDPLVAGEQLKVRAVLTGRVLQRGNNLNIQTDLVDVDRRAELWGQQYNETMADLLNVQEGITSQISEKLELHLTGDEKDRLTKRYTDNPEAYQFYLKGDFYNRRGYPDDFEKALSSFHQALNLDPNFALAYIGIANAYAVQTDFTFAPDVAMPEAKKALTKALSIDPEVENGRTWQGVYDFWYAWDWAAAEKGFREGLRQNPNSYLPHFFFSWYSLAQGDTLTALAEAKRMIELEPLSPEENWVYGHVLYYSHRFQDAFNFMQKSYDMAKDHPLTHLTLSWCYLKDQKFSEAIREARQLYELAPVPWSRAALAAVYAKTGDRAKAIALLDSLRDDSKRHLYVPSDVVASIYTALGDKDRAFEYLDKGFAERAGWMVWLKLDPNWDPLRSDPRFLALLKKMNLEK